VFIFNKLEVTPKDLWIVNFTYFFIQ